MHPAPKHVGVKENIPISSVPDIFEKDSWIRNVWTYQEVTNSKQLHFVGESFDNVLVEPGLSAATSQAPLHPYQTEALDSFNFAPIGRIFDPL